MNNRYLKALGSSSLSICPIIIIVLILSWTGLCPLSASRGDYGLLFVGMFVLIIGLSLFQIGASGSLTKVGEYMGSSLSKQQNLFIVMLFSIALGALITCAEPSIMIVTKQVSIPPFLLVGSIAIGVGVFVAIGILRIIFHRSLKLWYLFFYAIVFMLVFFIGMDEEKRAFLPFIFDSGGVTTGSATVPFIIALGVGVATVRGGKNSTNDSFGLVGLASIGPILTMTILILCSNNDTSYVPSYATLGENSIGELFLSALLPQSSSSLGSLLNVLIALLPILAIFFIYNAIFIHLPKNNIYKLLIGFGFCYLGLVLFLTAAGAAMTPIGNYVGQNLGTKNKGLVIVIAFIIGLVTILCEPAVHVLTEDMEKISDGRIGKGTVLATLSLGVGAAIAMAAIRTIYNFSIMYYIIPGYIISLSLMFVCPDIYTAMAFDSGGTASGPMSSSFVLPMIVGMTTAIYGSSANYYEQSFGVIALIAMTPIIAIQCLGVHQNIQSMRARKIMRQHIYTAEDAQIIHF